MGLIATAVPGPSVRWSGGRAKIIGLRPHVVGVSFAIHEDESPQTVTDVSCVPAVALPFGSVSSSDGSVGQVTTEVDPNTHQFWFRLSGRRQEVWQKGRLCVHTFVVVRCVERQWHVGVRRGCGRILGFPQVGVCWTASTSSSSHKVTDPSVGL